MVTPCMHDRPHVGKLDPAAALDHSCWITHVHVHVTLMLDRSSSSIAPAPCTAGEALQPNQLIKIAGRGEVAAALDAAMRSGEADGRHTVAEWAGRGVVDAPWSSELSEADDDEDGYGDGDGACGSHGFDGAAVMAAPCGTAWPHGGRACDGAAGGRPQAVWPHSTPTASSLPEPEQDDALLAYEAWRLEQALALCAWGSGGGDRLSDIIDQAGGGAGDGEPEAWDAGHGAGGWAGHAVGGGTAAAGNGMTGGLRPAVRFEAQIEILRAMGFPEDRAEEMLALTDGDTDGAVQLLLS